MLLAGSIVFAQAPALPASALSTVHVMVVATEATAEEGRLETVAVGEFISLKTTPGAAVDHVPSPPLFTAVAASVGLGNIAGVAIAVSIAASNPSAKGKKASDATALPTVRAWLQP